MVTSSIVVISVAAFIFYRHLLKTLRDNEIKELLEGNKCQNDKSYKIVFSIDIDKRTRSLDPDQFSELPDDIEQSKDFVLDKSDIIEENSLMYMDFIYTFISIFYEVSSVKMFCRLLNLVATFDKLSIDRLSRFPKFLKSIFIFSLICELNQIWSAEEGIQELVIVNTNDDDSDYNYDGDVFVTADVIEEVEDEFYSWALEIEQVNNCFCLNLSYYDKC